MPDDFDEVATQGQTGVVNESTPRPRYDVHRRGLIIAWWKTARLTRVDTEERVVR